MRRTESFFEETDKDAAFSDTAVTDDNEFKTEIAIGL